MQEIESVLPQAACYMHNERWDGINSLSPGYPSAKRFPIVEMVESGRNAVFGGSSNGHADVDVKMLRQQSAEFSFGAMLTNPYLLRRQPQLSGDFSDGDSAENAHA